MTAFPPLDRWDDDEGDAWNDDSGSSGYSDNDDPPPYSMYDNNPQEPRQNSARLGLINGRYSISCPTLQYQWTMFMDHEFSLVLTLQGDSIWGAFDFGMFNGIIHLPERPFQASNTPFEFSWRGVENGEGEIQYDDGNQHGWIKFLGDGEIEGMISVYGDATFQGTRVSGQQTRSERDARSLQYEWDTYSEEAHERARVGRWG
jgi:hypothetical protein